VSQRHAAPANRRADACCSQVNLLFALCASVFLSGCLTSVLAPILPARLDELHCPTFLRGAVFGAYPATVAVVSLFVPQLIDRFGRTPLLVLGLGAEGVLVMLFGVVRVHSPTNPAHGDAATVYIMLLLRVLTVRALARRRVNTRFQHIEPIELMRPYAQGVCEAMQNTVLLLFATDEFEEQGSLATVMGWEESCAGVGFIVGPSAGALLYQAGGFGAPFLVLGMLFLLLLPLIPFALRNVKQRAPHSAAQRIAARPPWRAYMTYDIVNAGMGSFLMGTCFGAIMPTLSPHLQRRLDLRKEWALGAVYTIPALVYGVSCPLAGILADQQGGYRKLMRFGFSLLAAAFLMMGPVPILKPLIPVLWHPGHPLAWFWAICAMAAFGVGGACGFVPTMPAMQRGAKHLGPAATEVIASTYWTVYFAGEGLGPSLGTLFVSALGPGWGFAAVAGMLIGFLETSRQYAKHAPAEEPLTRETEEAEGVELAHVVSPRICSTGGAGGCAAPAGPRKAKQKALADHGDSEGESEQAAAEEGESEHAALLCKQLSVRRRPGEAT